MKQELRYHCLLIKLPGSSKLQIITFTPSLLYSGFIKFLGPYYMVLITRRRKVGTICSHEIYSVGKSELIAIPSPIVWPNVAYSRDENRSFIFSMCKYCALPVVNPSLVPSNMKDASLLCFVSGHIIVLVFIYPFVVFLLVIFQFICLLHCDETMCTIGAKVSLISRFSFLWQFSFVCVCLSAYLSDKFLFIYSRL